MSNSNLPNLDDLFVTHENWLPSFHPDIIRKRVLQIGGSENSSIFFLFSLVIFLLIAATVFVRVVSLLTQCYINDV